MTRAAACLVMLALTGCSVHTTVIRRDYASFNQTIQYNQSQQMLLNLVRMKYRETPLFLKIGALSASYTFSAEAGAGLGKSGDTKSWNASVGAGYSTRPTITYTPLEGNTYVKQVMAEVSPETFVLLVRSGWPMTTLGNLLMEAVGDTVNNEDEPSYDRFLHLIDALQEAQDRRRITFLEVDDEIFLQVFSPRLDLYDPEEGETVLTHRIPLASFHLRSLMDIMFFLGKNTEVPEAHAAQVRGGRANGWIHIAATAGDPDNALVAVKHNGYHYSISREDIRSKDTFALLKLLYQIQAGDISSVQPVLTLPIAQP